MTAPTRISFKNDVVSRKHTECTFPLFQCRKDDCTIYNYDIVRYIYDCSFSPQLDVDVSLMSVGTDLD